MQISQLSVRQVALCQFIWPGSVVYVNIRGAWYCCCCCCTRYICTFRLFCFCDFVEPVLLCNFLVYFKNGYLSNIDHLTWWRRSNGLCATLCMCVCAVHACPYCWCRKMHGTVNCISLSFYLSLRLSAIRSPSLLLNVPTIQINIISFTRMNSKKEPKKKKMVCSGDGKGYLPANIQI